MSQSDLKLSRVVNALLDSPWAILESKLAVIAEIVAARAAGHVVSDADIRARLGGDPPKAPAAVTVNGVAVLSVFGILAPRMNLFTMASGGTSAEGLARDVRTAAADERIKAIVLAVDSPGGSCHLVTETAAAVRAARAFKPVTAVVSPLCASAAYWIAANASEIVATPSGDIGSIGVVGVHEDISKALEKAGVTVSLIAAGKHKTEANQFEPLSNEARATLQRRVDACYDQFVRDVAVGRGVSERDVRDGFGQGRLLSAHDAL
jgi:signal peptide peptidase SppA